jgi:hypothetical protein
MRGREWRTRDLSEPCIVYLEPPASSEPKVAQELQSEPQVSLENLPLPRQHTSVAENLEKRPSMGRAKVGNAEVVSIANVIAVEWDALDELDRLQVIGRPSGRFPAGSFLGGGQSLVEGMPETSDEVSGYETVEPEKSDQLVAREQGSQLADATKEGGLNVPVVGSIFISLGYSM